MHSEDIYIVTKLTPSQEEEEPPLFWKGTKDNYQHQVEHNAFTQHPAESCQKEVHKDGRDSLTSSLREKMGKCPQLLFSNNQKVTNNAEGVHLLPYIHNRNISY